MAERDRIWTPFKDKFHFILDEGSIERFSIFKSWLSPVVDVIKLFVGNLEFPKIRKLNKVCSDV